MPVRVDTEAYLSENMKKIDTMPEYRRFVADAADRSALRDLCGKFGKHDDSVLKLSVKEFSHQSEKSVMDNFETALRLKMMKADPTAHYSLLKRREKATDTEKLEDMKLRLGLRDPVQTDNNLSFPGTIRRERRIYETEKKRNDISMFVNEALDERKWKETKRPVRYPDLTRPLIP